LFLCPFVRGIIFSSPLPPAKTKMNQNEPIVLDWRMVKKDYFCNQKKSSSQRAVFENNFSL